jgi:magnesium-dependent phosphatase 1
VSHIGFGICAMTFRGFVLHSECRSKKENPSLYPEAMGILNALKQKGVTMAVASRTPTPDIANCFLNKLGIPSFFADMQIYPSYTHKVEHFQKIRQNTGIPYKSMLFFDDESRNIQSVSLLFLFLSQ